MEIKQYTDKSFVVVGEGTKEYKTQLGNLGGRWNGSLKDKETEEKFGGWVFSNTRREQVEKFLQSPESVEVPPKEKDRRSNNRTVKTDEDATYGSVKANMLETYPVKSGYQRVVYDLIVPEKGKDVIVVIGMNVTMKKVAMTMSSRNDGIIDTVYVSNDGNMNGDSNELGVVKIVNGEWQMMNMREEHKVSFVM